MLGVDAADAAHAVGRQELVLAQQVRQDARQHGVVDQRQQMLAALVLPVGTGADVVAVEQARPCACAGARGSAATLASSRWSITSVANSGIRPTIE